MCCPGNNFVGLGLGLLFVSQEIKYFCMWYLIFVYKILYLWYDDWLQTICSLLSRCCVKYKGIGGLWLFLSFCIWFDGPPKIIYWVCWVNMLFHRNTVLLSLSYILTFRSETLNRYAVNAHRQHCDWEFNPTCQTACGYGPRGPWQPTQKT